MLRPSHALLSALALASLLLSGCAFHSTSKEWHGLVGPNGKPVYLMTSTHIGFNLLVVLPLVGDTDVPTQVKEVTGAIAAEDGDNVRIVQTGSENYWYGWPPLTWILTPVVSTTMAEYEPDEATLKADHAAWQGPADPQ